MKVPLLNYVGGPGVPLLNFEGGLGVPLLNFGGPRVARSRVPGSWSHFYTMPSFMTKNVIIQKPVHWFAEQINGLVSAW